MINIVLVFIGGGLGACLRYLVSFLVNKYPVIPHYYGTLFINILGSLFLGFVIAYLLGKNTLFHYNLKTFFVIGLAGGFTTFSTFSFEALTLLRDGQIIVGFSYMLLSPILTVLAAYVGFSLGK